MPMHTGPRRPSKTNTNSNGNDSKTLEILYRQQIPTLRELFPGWSREDLVAAINETDGDLELAISRIMEGHANQWGQVKSKKSKPSASSTGGTQNTNARKIDEQAGPRGTSTHSGKSRHERSRGKSGDKLQRKKKEKEEPLKHHLEDEKKKKPSWASILKGPTKIESPISEPATTPIPKNTTFEKAIEPDGTDVNGDNSKKIDTTMDSLSTNQQIANESESADVIVEQPDDIVVDSEEVTNDTNNANELFEPSIQTVADDDDVDASTKTIPTTAASATEQQVGTQEPHQIAGFRKVTVRRLKQYEPVILPGGRYGLGNVSLQFGSLNLTNGEEQYTDENKQGELQQQQQQKEEETTTNTSATTIPTDVLTTVGAPHTQSITSSSASTNMNTQVPSALDDSTAVSEINACHEVYLHQTQPQSQPQFQQKFPSHPATQSQQPQIQKTLQSQQQHQQQHDTVPTTDAHIYPYATYIPSTIPGNGHLQGFTNPAMGTVPDHYNHAGQNSVTYGDLNVYNQSPSINNTQLYSHGKYSNKQEGMASPHTSLGMMGSSISTSTSQVPQQPQGGMYGENTTVYDSYYYMPNQYQSYQHIGYQPPPTLQQQQHQPQQAPQQTQQQQSKQPQSSYANSNIYPMYGKQNHSAYQNYPNQQQQQQQPYDVGMLHSSRTQGLVYDKQQYQPPSNLPQRQHYFDGNDCQLQQQAQQTDITNGGQPIIDFDKQQGLSMPQPMVTPGNYQPHYHQQYHHQPQQQQQQQQQQSFYHQQLYNPSTHNNTINAYSTWQNQPQQPLYWQQA